MEPEISERLVEINRLFYRRFASEFSATRQRLQSGVQRLLERIPMDAKVLDVGCGNGELWRELVSRGHQGSYTGLDFSPDLLAIARRDNPTPRRAIFFERDLASPDWEIDLALSFDIVLAFAVFHHLPGERLHQQILRKIHALLAPEGKLFHSNWQFLNSSHWRDRIQPWEIVGLDADDVDPGDYLLDWRRGGTGYRYVHHFSEGELSQLASGSGFTVIDSCSSDGKEGNLGLYQVWARGLD